MQKNHDVKNIKTLKTGLAFLIFPFASGFNYCYHFCIYKAPLFFFFFKCLFNLALLGLSCVTWDLWFQSTDSSCGMWA